MSTPFCCLASFLLVLLASAPAWADACFPFLRPHPREFWREAKSAAEHDLTIVRDAEANQVELRIPRKLMIAEAVGGSSTRYAMTGLAISAAFVGGGLWCLRYHDKVPKKTVLAIGAAMLLLVVGMTLSSFAEATPPRKPPGWEHLKAVVQFGDIDVQVRVVDDAADVQLVLPAEIADKITGR